MESVNDAIHGGSHSEKQLTESPSHPHLYSSPPIARTSSSSVSSNAARTRALRGMQSPPNLGPVNISNKPTMRNGAFATIQHQRSSDSHTSSSPSRSPQVQSRISSTSTTDSDINVKDEKQAKKNDTILHERLMEAKSFTTKGSGAVLHKFSLWNGAKKIEDGPTSGDQSAVKVGLVPADDSVHDNHKPLMKVRGRGPKAAIELQNHYSPSTATKLTTDPPGPSSVDTIDNHDDRDKGSKPGSFKGLTSSLRNKIDLASRSSERSSSVGSEHDRAPSIGSKHSAFDNRHLEPDDGLGTYSLDEFDIDDDDDEIHTILTIEEEDDLRQKLSSSELDDGKVTHENRSSLPGIAMNHSHRLKIKRRSKNTEIVDEKAATMPFVMKIPLNPVPLVSSVSTADDSMLQPPPVTKAKSVARHDWDGQDVQPSIDSLNRRDRNWQTPQVAFGSRPPSLSTSGNVSKSNTPVLFSKEETNHAMFIPIAETPPDSRSHSISAPTALVLPFVDPMQSVSIAVVDDYVNEEFDDTSPALSVLTHMSTSERDLEQYGRDPQPPVEAVRVSEEKPLLIGNVGRKHVQAPVEEIDGYCEIVYVGCNGDCTIRWKRGQPIGEGTFGRVYKGLNESTGELAAVKQLSIGSGSDADVDSIRKEIRVMWQLNHENIVRYLGTSQTDRYFFIVLEYVSGGSIASMLLQFGSFSESLIRKICFHVICGLDYLHQKGIIHRDIKGANVLVTDTGIAKIADFGCSKQLAGLCTTSLEESLKTIRGSVPWMAPEVIKQSGQGRAADIWSVGATLIEMATGKPPWAEFTDNLAALFHVATSKEPPPVPKHLSRTCAAFLTKCMVIDSTKRATANELLQFDDFICAETESQKRSK